MRNDLELRRRDLLQAAAATTACGAAASLLPATARGAAAANGTPHLADVLLRVNGAERRVVGQFQEFS